MSSTRSQIRTAFCGRMFVGTLFSATSMFLLLYTLPSQFHVVGIVITLSLAPVCGLLVEALVPESIPKRVLLKVRRDATSMPARLRRLHVLGKLSLISVWIIISWSFPPLFFAMLVAWAVVVPIPHFRSASYCALILATACLWSPLGWGMSHQPSSSVNLLMSFAFFGFVGLSGLRAILSWWQERVPIRFAVLAGETAIVLAIAYYGSQSLIMQSTSLPDQRQIHAELISIALAALLVFGVLEYARQHAMST